MGISESNNKEGGLYQKCIRIDQLDIGEALGVARPWAIGNIVFKY